MCYLLLKLQTRSTSNFTSFKNLKY
uniref:Uncharacterized protein n=1 Tax=Rhizophora mucronata TaxID=61149 RepID=A0A2P2QCE0_RHIMU